jgi:hypothetical protein
MFRRCDNPSNSFQPDGQADTVPFREVNWCENQVNADQFFDRHSLYFHVIPCRIFPGGRAHGDLMCVTAMIDRAGDKDKRGWVQTRTIEHLDMIERFFTKEHRLTTRYLPRVSHFSGKDKQRLGAPLLQGSVLFQSPNTILTFFVFGIMGKGNAISGRSPPSLFLHTRSRKK